MLRQPVWDRLRGHAVAIAGVTALLVDADATVLHWAVRALAKITKKGNAAAFTAVTARLSRSLGGLPTRMRKSRLALPGPAIDAAQLLPRLAAVARARPHLCQQLRERRLPARL